MSEEKKDVAAKEPGYFARIPWGSMLVTLIVDSVVGGMLCLVCFMMAWSEIREAGNGFVNGLMIFLQVFFGLILLFIATLMLHVVAAVGGDATDKKGHPCALLPLPGFIYILVLAGFAFLIGYFLFGNHSYGHQFNVFWNMLRKCGIGGAIHALFLLLMQLLLLLCMITPLALYLRAAIKRLKVK